MELWDIYDVNKQKTGRTMVRNDWHMKPGDYHLTVLALVKDLQGGCLLRSVSLTRNGPPVNGKSREAACGPEKARRKPCCAK